MAFFVKLLANLSFTILAKEAQITSSKDEALFHCVVMMSNLFDGVARNNSLATFATLGGLGEHCQGFVFGQLSSAILENWDAVLDAALKRYPDLTPRTLQPYVTATSPPNIISPLHLCCQALCAENVSSYREPS